MTPDLKAKADAIMAKYNYKPAQAQAQPANDWFTATAPKPKSYGLVPDIGIGAAKAATAIGEQSDTLGTINHLSKGDNSDIDKAKLYGLPKSVDVLGTMNEMAGRSSNWTGVEPPAMHPSQTPDWTGMSPAERMQATVPTNTGQKIGSTAVNSAFALAPFGSKIKEFSPLVQAAKDTIKNATPHPIDALRGYADSTVKAGIETDVKNLLTATKSIGKKAGQAAKMNTDFQKILSDPQVFKGLKVENGKINPAEAIDTIESRIQPLLEAKRSILPKIDQLVPTTPRATVWARAVDYINRSVQSKTDKAAAIQRMDAQLNSYPEQLIPSEIDSMRADMRGSARDAKGQMKSDSEYAALENAARDTVFDITDKLPIPNAGEYKALNDYVKQMITTKEFLDTTLRNQVVKGGRLGSYTGKIIGATIGASHGPLASLAGSEIGGTVADIITNNALGSSFKMSLIKQLTDDTAILTQAEKLLADVHDVSQPLLPGGNPNNAHPVINEGRPIIAGQGSASEYVGKDVRVGQDYKSQPGNILRSNQEPSQTASTISNNQSMSNGSTPSDSVKGNPEAGFIKNPFTPVMQFDLAKLKESIKTSGHDYDPAIAAGDIKPEQIFKSGKILQPDVAEHVLSDIVEKINQRFQKGLGDEFKATVDLKNATVDGLQKQAFKFLDDVPKAGGGIPNPISMKDNPEAGFFKNPFSKTPLAKETSIADTIDSVFVSAREILKKIPAAELKAEGGLMAAMSHIQRNVVDTLKNAGFDLESKMIERVNPKNHVSIDNFERALYNAISLPPVKVK